MPRKQRDPVPRKNSINLTDVLTLIVQEIAQHCGSFRHIDVRRLLVCIASNRNGRGATYGKLVPLRFKYGAETLRHRGRLYAMPHLMAGGLRQMYVIYFYYPKFFNLPALEKLRVVFHELYHINPEFNGDIRRMARVKTAHGGSRESFDKLFNDELQAFFAYICQTPYINFLDLDSKALNECFSRIFGRRMKLPQPVPVKP